MSFKNSSNETIGVAYSSDTSAMAEDWTRPKRACYHMKNVKIGPQHLVASKYKIEKANSSCSAPILIAWNIPVIADVDYLLQALSRLTQWIALRSIEAHLTLGFKGTVVSHGGPGSADPERLLFG